MSETAYVIKRLAQAGVEIFEYVHGQSLTPRTSVAKLMSSVQSYADEDHREKTRERTHESHADKFRRGHVVGGRVFGYRNVHIYNGEDEHGNPRRSHTVREVDAKEAEVVRRIFELYVSGLGLKAIAKHLTSEGAVFPKPFKRKDETKVLPVNGWAPSTVRAILCRELYRGVATWNRSRKRDDWGQKNQTRRPESDWMHTEVERIVSDDLWHRVSSRREDMEGRAVRFASGRLSGRPPKHSTVNLLAGLATCSVCGGGLLVETSGRKVGRVPQYVCYRRRHNENLCTNALRISVAVMNEAVLCAVEEHALTPEAIEQVIQLTERDDAREHQAALEREGKDIEKRIKRVNAAIEMGEPPISLLAKLRELEARRADIDSSMARLRPVPRLPQEVIEDRLAEWRRLLRQSTTQGRAVLQRVIRGRITFTPRADGQGYDFTAPTRFDKLFTGIAAPRPAWLPTADVPGHIGVADLPDEDYGQLLDRAVYGLGLASPAGFEPALPA